MDRRKFIKVVGLGAMAFYLSGCGLMAVDDKKKKEVTVSELGKALFLDSGTISPLIRKLQEKGYVDLSNDKSDERITHVILSEEGLSLREKALRVPEQIGSCIHLNTEDALNLYRILYQIISDLTGEENRYDK